MNPFFPSSPVPSLWFLLVPLTVVSVWSRRVSFPLLTLSHSQILKKASFLLWLIRVSSSEPSIAVSESVTLPVEGDALTLQCNLTSANDVHQESFWMKNGEEIPDTRSPNKNTEYRSDPQQSLMRQCGREWWSTVWRGFIPAGFMFYRLHRPRADDAGVYMCVYSFEMAPPGNATIEVKCRCRLWTTGMFDGFKAALQKSPIKKARVAWSVQPCDGDLWFQTAPCASLGQPAPLTPPSNQWWAQWQQMASCLSNGRGLCFHRKICWAFSALAN